MINSQKEGSSSLSFNSQKETKYNLIKHNKKIEDYSDDEMEAMIAEAESGLNEDVRTGLLTALLVGAGIEIVAGG